MGYVLLITIHYNQKLAFYTHKQLLLLLLLLLSLYTLNEIVQGRLRENKKTYAFFLDIQKLMILFGMMVYGINCGTWA